MGGNSHALHAVGANGDTGLPVPSIPIGHYHIRFRAEEPISFSQYSGSAWRGAFGHALRRAVCVTREPNCSGCMLYRTCAYPYIFETPPPPDTRKMRKYPAAPHPFVIRPEPSRRQLNEGDHTELGLVLVGNAHRHLPYVIYALQRAGSDGVGKGRGRLALTEVLAESPTGSDDFESVFHLGGELLPTETKPPETPRPPQARIRFKMKT